VLVVVNRYRHRRDLLAVVEQQIELVGMAHAWKCFQSQEFSPR
jgi:hypothetical protein